MNSLNSVIIEGIATNEPKVHITSTQNCVVSFMISCTRTYKVDEEYKKEISYFMVEAWGDLAKEAQEKVKYGVPVKVMGRLKQDRWDSPDGEHLTRVKIMANNITY
jgi:single-strand DNA-binding protein